MEGGSLDGLALWRNLWVRNFSSFSTRESFYTTAFADMRFSVVGCVIIRVCANKTLCISC